MTIRLTEHEICRREVSDWNKHIPIGSKVVVIRDSGEIIHTSTKSEAWLLGSHTPVVMLHGISGCYALNRVQFLEAPASPTGV